MPHVVTTEIEHPAVIEYLVRTLALRWRPHSFFCRKSSHSCFFVETAVLDLPGAFCHILSHVRKRLGPGVSSASPQCLSGEEIAHVTVR